MFDFRSVFLFVAVALTVASFGLVPSTVSAEAVEVRSAVLPGHNLAGPERPGSAADHVPECLDSSRSDPAIGTLPFAERSRPRPSSASSPAVPDGGCPDGVWAHDHDADEDYGDGIGVTWCKYTSSYTITITGGFSAGRFIQGHGSVAITITYCVYGGCDLDMTEETANTGGQH